jgi:hypothetical protein
VLQEKLPWFRRQVASREPYETILSSRETQLKQTTATNSRLSRREVAMNQIVANVLMREAAKARAGSETLSILILFCSLGLLASLCMMSLGFDVSGGIF